MKRSKKIGLAALEGGWLCFCAAVSLADDLPSLRKLIKAELAGADRASYVLRLDARIARLQREQQRKKLLGG